MRAKQRPVKSLDMSVEVFVEEYWDFVRMGLSHREMARSFGLRMDAFYHRLKRAGIEFAWEGGRKLD